MIGTLESSGIASRQMFEKLLPSPERRASGPYIVMECYEEIPCNPCSTSCPFHVVKMENINNLPQCDLDKCTGCGNCVGRCPGLACFVIDETVGNGKIKVTIPYEMVPLPAVGDIVDALGRDGEVVGKAKVLRVLSTPKLDHTSIITILVDKELLYEARNIRCE